MSKHKSDKEESCTTEAEACEIIELAVDDIEVLTRAFNLIAEVCRGRDELPAVEKERTPPGHLLN